MKFVSDSETLDYIINLDANDNKNTNNINNTNTWMRLWE